MRMKILSQFKYPQICFTLAAFLSLARGRGILTVRLGGVLLRKEEMGPSGCGIPQTFTGAATQELGKKVSESSRQVLWVRM